MHHDLGRTNGGGLYRNRDYGASERYFNVLLGYALMDCFFRMGHRLPTRKGAIARSLTEGDTQRFNMASQ